jgi:hypothetical protein
LKWPDTFFRKSGTGSDLIMTHTPLTGRGGSENSETLDEFGGSKRGDWKEERIMPLLLGGLQKTEKEDECSDIEKREGSGGSQSQVPIERRGGNGKNRKDSRRPSDGQPKWTDLDLDAISEFLGTENSSENS